MTESGIVAVARRRLRTAGYSQAALADLLGMSPSNLSQWLRYDWNPTARNLDRIATALGLEWTLGPPQQQVQAALELAGAAVRRRKGGAYDHGAAQGLLNRAVDKYLEAVRVG